MIRVNAHFSVWYKLPFKKKSYLLKDLSTSRNTVGQPVMSSKFDGGPIDKHKYTGLTDKI